MPTICIFGDSIAWGEGDPKYGGWVARLKRYFDENKVAVSVYNLSIDGNTSVGLIKRFKTEAFVREPEIIIFAIGINDSIYQKPGETPLIPIEDFSANLIRLAQEAQVIARQTVFIGLTQVDETKTQPFLQSSTGKCYSNQRIAKYNQVIKQVSQNRNCLFFDLFKLLSNSNLDDGLHPNEDGHQKILV